MNSHGGEFILFCCLHTQTTVLLWLPPRRGLLLQSLQ